MSHGGLCSPANLLLGQNPRIPIHVEDSRARPGCHPCLLLDPKCLIAFSVPASYCDLCPIPPDLFACPLGPPYATIIPEHTSVQSGKPVQLQCLAHGTPPLTYQWSLVGSVLPEKAVARNQLLHLEPTDPADSGRYRCQVSNRVGSAEAFAQVLVQGKQPESRFSRDSVSPQVFNLTGMYTWDKKASACLAVFSKLPS